MKLKIKRKVCLVIIFIVTIFICNISCCNSDINVFITKTGSKFHTSNCSYLKFSSCEISLSDAIKRGYEPCSRCRAYSVLSNYIVSEDITDKEEIKERIHSIIDNSSEAISFKTSFFKPFGLLIFMYCGFPVLLKILKINFNKKQILNFIIINNLIQYILINLLIRDSAMGNILYAILFGIIEYLVVGGKIINKEN